MIAENRRLREERGRLLQEAETIRLSGFTPEKRIKFDKLMDQADEHQARINQLEHAAPPSDPIDERTSKRDLDYRSAFRSYLVNGLYADQYGFKGVTDSERQILTERRDMGTGGGNALQGSGGGYFVPVGFVNDVETAMKFYGEMLMSSTIMETASGQPLPHPTSNDTSILGELVGEGQQVTAQDVSIGSIIYNAYKYSTKVVKVSIELLQDSAFDIENFLKEQFAFSSGES